MPIPFLSLNPLSKLLFSTGKVIPTLSFHTSLYLEVGTLKAYLLVALTPIPTLLAAILGAYVY